MTENISWRQKIKKLQIIFFVILIVFYFSYNYMKNVYNDYNIKKTELEDLKIKKIAQKEEKLAILKTKVNLYKKIIKNYRAFQDSYNECNPVYIEKLYGVEKINLNIGSGDKLDISSLSNCIDDRMGTRVRKYDHFIKQLKDVEITDLVKALGVNKNELEKMNFDHKRILASLDQDIFDNSLEDIEVITFGKPVLIDKKKELYKVSFSFVVEVNYKQFINLLDRFQSELLLHKVFYTIDSVSDFDLTKEKTAQKITIQGNFYFTK